jgi:hypothetical protein
MFVKLFNAVQLRASFSKVTALVTSRDYITQNKQETAMSSVAPGFFDSKAGPMSPSRKSDAVRRTSQAVYPGARTACCARASQRE